MNVSSFARVSAALVLLAGCDPFTGDWVHVNEIRKSARATIRPFSVGTAPYEVVVQASNLRLLANELPLPSTPECAAAIDSAIATCHASNGCSLDAMRAAVEDTCGVDLATWVDAVGKPRLLAWLAEATRTGIAGIGATDPYVGLVEVDPSSYLDQTIDYGALDVSVRRILEETPVTIRFIRRYRDTRELFGDDADKIQRVLALKEVELVSLTEVALRTLLPTEIAQGVSDADLLGPDTYQRCVSGQVSFRPFRHVEVSIARDVAPWVGSDGGIADAGVDGTRAIAVSQDYPTSTTPICSIFANRDLRVNLLPYVRGDVREIELRVVAEAPLPIVPSVPRPCADDPSFDCPAPGMVQIGGYVWLLIHLRNLDEHSLQHFLDALDEPRDQ